METELERLVIRLVGDSSSYIKMLEESTSSVSEFATNVTQSTTQATDRVATEMQRMGQSMSQVAGATGTEELTQQQQEAANAVMQNASAIDNLNKTVQDANTSQEGFNNSVGKTTEEVAASKEKIDEASGSVGKFAGILGNAVAAIGGLSLLKEAFGNFAEAEQISLKLEAALKANKRDVEALTQEYTDFAAELERTTTAEDDAILKLLQTAESMGITGEQAMRAAKNAVSLAAAYDMDAQSAIRMTTALEQGRSEMLGKYLPALRGIEDDAERAAKAQELLTNMFGAAEAQAASTSGQLGNLSRDFGNLLEDIGAVVATAITPFVKMLSKVVELYRSMPSWVKTATTALLVYGVAIKSVAAYQGLFATAAGVTTATELSKTTGVLTNLANVGATSGATISKHIGIFGGVKTAVTGAAIGVGGFIKSLVTSPLGKFAVAVGVVYGSLKLLKTGVIDNTEAVKLWKDTIESTTGSTNLLLKKLEESNEETKQAIETLSGLGDRDVKMKFLQDEINKSSDALRMFDRHVKDAKEQLDKLSVFEMGSGTKKLGLEKQLENTTKLADAMKDRVKNLQSEMDKMLDPKKDPKIVEAVNSLTNSLKEQSATFGMTASQAELYKLKAMGASEEQLAKARELTHQLNLMSLERKIETHGMNELQIAELETAKARQVEIEAIQKQEEELRKLREEIDGIAGLTVPIEESEKYDKRLKDLVKSFDDLTDTVDSAKKKMSDIDEKNSLLKMLEDSKAAEEEFAKLVAKADQLKEQFRSPEEIFNDTVKELNELLSAGVLDATTYERAIEAARKALKDATESTKDLKEEMSGIDAVSRNSAEALTRLNRYTESLRRDMKKGIPHRLIGMGEGKPGEVAEAIKPVELVKPIPLPKAEDVKAEMGMKLEIPKLPKLEIALPLPKLEPNLPFPKLEVDIPKIDSLKIAKLEIPTLPKLEVSQPLPKIEISNPDRDIRIPIEAGTPNRKIEIGILREIRDSIRGLDKEGVKLGKADI